MTACNKCWDQAWVEARYGTGETQIEAYYRILKENQDKPHHRTCPDPLGTWNGGPMTDTPVQPSKCECWCHVTGVSHSQDLGYDTPCCDNAVWSLSAELAATREERDKMALALSHGWTLKQYEYACDHDEWGAVAGDGTPTPWDASQKEEG